MMSISFEIDFSVRVNTNAGEVVCVTGDSPELGDWLPHKAVKLMRQSTRRPAVANADLTQKFADGDVWTRRIRFEGLQERQYRFLVGKLYNSENEDEDSSVEVQRWETNIKPRRLSPKQMLKNTKPDPGTATFGEYDGQSYVGQGWLIDQSQINIYLHSNPIQMWNPRNRNQTYSVKCTPVDHKYRDECQDGEEEECLPSSTNTVVHVAVLEKGRSRPAQQDTYGAVYTPDCFMCFMAQTLDPEHLGFRLDFYLHSDCPNIKDNVPRHVGYSHILPLDVKRSTDTKTIPINGLKHSPVGQIIWDYLLVKPMSNVHQDLSVSYQGYWKPSRQTLDIAHRGMGTSYYSAKVNTTRENTVKSLMDAANHGADFVELDVHLSRDKEAIIYHDFKVFIKYRQKQQNEVNLFQVPVKDLSLAELQSMKLSHTAKAETMEENQDDYDPDDLQPFPLLKRCLEAVDMHTGFNIEIKYPQKFQNGIHEQENFPDLNQFLDIILKVIVDNHGGRRIIFSSFDCNTCIALRLKQNRYPVLLLTQADTKVWEMFADTRAQSIQAGTEFCLAHALQGVDVMAEILLKDLTLIDYVKNSGLVLFVWGDHKINDTNVINTFKQLKVDGIIYDRIDHFKTSGKESIFKVERDNKMQGLLQQYPPSLSGPISIEVTDPSSSGSDST